MAEQENVGILNVYHTQVIPAEHAVIRREENQKSFFCALRGLSGDLLILAAS